MATVTIEALKVGEETDRLVDELSSATSDHPLEEAGTGRWRVELPDAESGEEAEETIEAELDGLDDAGGWRERLRVTGADD